MPDAVAHLINVANGPVRCATTETRDKIRSDVEQACEQLLRALRIDTANDPQTRDTPRRMAKMLVDEALAGRYEPMPAVTAFANDRQDEVYAIGPIAVRSLCAHHFVPIMGQAWVAVLPGTHLIGLSKFHRIAQWVFARPIMQEEATMMLADRLEEVAVPQGLAVVVRAAHMCCQWRGVRDGATTMSTSVMRGVFRTEPEARSEALRLMQGSGL